MNFLFFISQKDLSKLKDYKFVLLFLYIHIKLTYNTGCPQTISTGLKIRPLVIIKHMAVKFGSFCENYHKVFFPMYHFFIVCLLTLFV